MIGGTTIVQVARWSWISPRKPARSKRGMETTVAPTRRLQGRIRFWPMAWKNGATPTTTSSAVNPIAACDWRALATRLAWVSSTPLGRPVVPLE
jgi:hypothetical protein